mgnify:CR=1 FL=1
MAGFEGVAVAVGLALLFVEQRHRQGETAQQLDQPLVSEACRHQNQGPLGAPGEQQPVQDQAGLDGLAKAHFIGQQHARRLSRGDLVGDVQLMRDQIDAWPGEAEGRVLLDAVVMVQGAKAQVEPVVAVDLAGQQAVAGLIELHAVGEACLG